MRDADADGSHGWRIVQLAELLRSFGGLVGGAEEELRDLTASMAPDAVVELPRERLAAIAALADDVLQLALRAQALAEALPDEPLDVDYDAIAEAAAAELAEGVLDPDRALLAARLLPRPAGWRALAHCLRALDVRDAWQDLTVGELLGAFRDVAPVVAERTAEAAGIAAAAELADCTPEEIARLASALEARAAR